MEYRGIEYKLVQSANPYGWKWTVSLPHGQQVGNADRKEDAILRVWSVVDKFWRAQSKIPERVSVSN